MMLPIRFVTLCLATLNLIHCKTYTGTYKTISPELQKLFQNNFKDRLSIWESSTCYKTFGLPHYEVGCHGTPNIAQNRTGSLTIPDEHYINSTSFCTSGGPIGYAVNGVALFNALDGRGRDAYYYEAETFDSCGAHTAPTEDYHYHIVPGSLCPSMLGSENCFPRIRVPATLQSSLGTTFLVGVANDGFPIFVTADANDRVREETELDNCGGKVIDNTYAYYVKPFFPYILGCYKGQIPRSSSCGDSDKKMCYCRGPTATTVNCLEELEGTLCPAEEPVPCGTMNGRCYNMIISDKGTFDNGLTNNPSDGSGCPNRTGGPDGMRPPPPGGMGRPRPNGVDGPPPNGMDGPPPNGMDGSLVNEMGGSPSTGMGQPPQNGMGGSLLNGIIGSPSNGMGQPPPDEMNGSPSNGMGGSLPNQIGGPLPNSMNGASLNGGMGIGQNDQNSEVGGMYPQWALNSLGRGNQQQYVPYYASRRGSQSIYPWSQQILRYLFNSAAVLGNGQGMQNSPPQQGNQPNMQYPPPQQPGNQYLPSQGNQQQGNQYLPPQGNQQQGNQYPPQGNQQQGNQYIPPQGNQQPANQYLSPQGNQQQGNQYIPPQGNQQQGNQYLPPQGNQQGNQFPPPQGNQQQGNQYLPPPPRDQQGNQYLPPQGNQQQGNQYLPPQGNQQQGNQYLPPQGNQYLPPQGNQQGNQYLPPPPRDQQGMQYLPPQY